MKKLVCIVVLSAALAGCAATAFKTARTNANQVQNGMTLTQVTELLGSQPTYVSGGYAYWKRGNAQEYNGTNRGAIRFQLVEGKVVNIPTGGIFSEAAVKAYKIEHAAQLAERNKREAAAEAERERVEEELRKAAVIVCHDKVTCGKVFALAQIYASQASDQKIQVATDTVIQTYNPTEVGNSGLTIYKTPRSGSTEEISIIPSCKTGEFRVAVDLCNSKRKMMILGFKPFIDSKISLRDSL